METSMTLGVSSCLLGNPVRYDGGHKHDRYITGTLAAYFKLVPVCPEVECGLGIPRESMRLVGAEDQPRLVTTKTGIDHTDRMKAWAETRLDELAGLDMCGFIFKKQSPSSGLYRVKIYSDKAIPSPRGTGIFAQAFVNRFPRIPVEEEGRLFDNDLRENFIERVFTMKRWRESLALGPHPRVLMDFHTRHKLLILSHSQKGYRIMGKHVAQTTRKTIEEDMIRYEVLLSEAMALKATGPKQINVMMHMLGYFKKQLSADEKAELLEQFDHYRAGQVPLIVPLTLINHYVRKYDQPYLRDQVYLNPHPLELKLRNHV